MSAAESPGPPAGKAAAALARRSVLWLRRGAVLLLAGYGLLCLTMWMAQRQFLYFPDPRIVEPAEVGVPATVLQRTAADGVALRMWWAAPRDGKPVVIHFHGNGGNLALWARVFRDLTHEGYGVLALSYRGYGGSGGAPSEVGLTLDARAAYAAVVERAPGARIVLFGDSLGTGVATRLAAEQPIHGLILNAPFTAVADRAQDLFWYLPVGFLLSDTFRSREWIAKVRAPILILHGDADLTIPLRHGAALFALAPEPKQFVTIAGGGHNGLWRNGGREAVLGFLSRLPP
jgi:fermentation-respiration switch protein FrsA (DUF1100 family)